VNSILTCKLVAAGAWGPGFTNCQQFSALVNGDSVDPEATVAPKPQIIPANERRRAPLPVRLAVETSWQATQNADIDPQLLSSVFVSGFGDTQLTDYMCRVLASENKLLSPTKFHNSVHNAAAGYWTISTGCERAANSVAGFQESVPLALMEAMVQCQRQSVPLLLTFYDAPVSAVLTDILGAGSAFSYSAIIAPVESPYAGRIVTAEVIASASGWPLLTAKEEQLQGLYESSPAARIIAFAEHFLLSSQFAESTPKIVGKGPLIMPLSKGTSLQITTDSAYAS